jgi:hypothetical protein
MERPSKKLSAIELEAIAPTTSNWDRLRIRDDQGSGDPRVQCGRRGTKSLSRGPRASRRVARPHAGAAGCGSCLVG